jgi:FKBP-type peptidyl-prolyl cis-trans isomerase SlyD
MIQTHRDTLLVVAAASLLACAGILLWLYHGAEHVRISEGSRVLLLYQMTIRGEEEVSEAPHVAQFVQGQHQFLPALERVVKGKKTGDTLKVVLSEDDTFGSYDVTKKKTVPRTDLPGGIKEGDVLKDRAGKAAIVTELSDRSAVIDYNHPWAGKSFIVKIKILRVDDPNGMDFMHSSGPRMIVKHDSLIEEFREMGRRSDGLIAHRHLV